MLAGQYTSKENGRQSKQNSHANPRAMPQLCKPLPALYVVYVLRSTVRHASLYIGSTPDPQRRLKQHNGLVKGGATRTSRASLRPWEMIMVVSGFPSSVAALKFEWALANAHITLHIPSEARLAISNKKKRNGHPRRPPLSLRSVVSNIHLLTGVPSFARWPLKVHFFAKEAHAAWESWTRTAEAPTRKNLDIITDFGPSGPEGAAPSGALWGAGALPSNYTPIKEYVEKAQGVVTFEQEGQCVHCHGDLESGKGLHPMCPNSECVAMGHLDCWSKYALAKNEEGQVLPDLCQCPSCGGDIRWGDMMKELSLRIRGAKDVQTLLKKGRRSKKETVEEEDQA
ncbi:hypothetical protein B0I35DRAFT_431665 [Stachybotrys elegans]|uniref:GIY-YIG domain-containing protein n=1 Tax=Stachybotrys elegans TaxID=80388 RepID=A0A8K0SNQ3_9HYPO|nr:hypothetical protein B0I35DRAFT_431665 [Stachybotrys elegans]